jgi:hypothetical protein
LGIPQDSLHFAGKAQPQSKKQSYWQRFQQWLNGWEQKIRDFFKWLSASLFGTSVRKPKVIGPVSKVDPKLVSDPHERTRIAYLIADETWPEVLKLYQQEPGTLPGSLVLDNSKRSWNQKASDLLTRSAQKHLHTTATARLKFLEDKCSWSLGEFDPPGRVAGPGTPRESLGTVEIFWPNDLPRGYDLSRESDRQMLYSKYVHEIHHMVRSYAFDFVHGREDHTPKPSVSDPVKKLYIELAAAEFGTSHGLCDTLAKQHPALKQLPLGSVELLSSPPQEVQAYLEPLRKMWERTDYNYLGRRRAVYEKLFREGDPKLIEYYLHRSVIEELESYMTAGKREAQVSPDQLQPRDLLDFGAGYYLRNLLNLYYEVRKIPKAQQHPYAHVQPLKLFP